MHSDASVKRRCKEARPGNLLIDYWMGHENDDMSTRYGKQLLEDVNYRKEWAEKSASVSTCPRRSRS